MYEQTVHLKRRREFDRQQYKQVLEKLFFTLFRDAHAFSQLDQHCRDSRYIMDDESRRTLSSSGLIHANGFVPDIVHNAMYELRSGERPEWLKLNGQIIQFPKAY